MIKLWNKYNSDVNENNSLIFQNVLFVIIYITNNIVIPPIINYVKVILFSSSSTIFTLSLILLIYLFDF